MHSINLFVEDRGHEVFLQALITGDSLSKLLKELRFKFQEWQQPNPTQVPSPSDTSNPLT